ncbi:hypothetical protein JCGZ_06608 [Jatropha curcas]|uniref:Uncharacterized protein n=1 Tax=Jatropha curcas TaxID=180498 RepID=A0A067LCG2_JATCU|nr:hypothetical protein JCGZ_06608 [Jatropha curcas]
MMARLSRTARTIAPLTAGHAKVSDRRRLTSGSSWFVIVRFGIRTSFLGDGASRVVLNSELAGVGMDSQRKCKRCATIGVPVWLWQSSARAKMVAVWVAVKFSSQGRRKRSGIFPNSPPKF